MQNIANGTFETSCDVRSVVANGLKRTSRGPPNSVEIDPKETFGCVGSPAGALGDMGEADD